MSFTRSLIEGDIRIESGGKFRYISKVDEISQRIITTLKHNWQEYFLNIPGGVPWYEIILGSKDLLRVESILRGVILEVPGVVSIVSFSITNSGRNYNLNVSVEVFVNGVNDIIDIAETFFIG